MKENLVIELSKKTDACFAYTDRNQSYFQIHCKNNKLTDGLWKDNINFIKNIFIYDIKTKHKIFPVSFDKILYKPHEVELIYKSFSLKISLIIQKFQENLKNQQESDFPILRFSFSSLDKDTIKDVMEALETLTDEKTVIHVTHQTELLKGYHRILKIGGGRIYE